MNTLNNKMLFLLTEVICAGKELDTSLNHVLSEGFTHVDDCFFIKRLFETQTHINKTDFIDKTGYECFINSLHIDDYVDHDFMPQAMLFMVAVFKAWNQKSTGKLKCIISQTEFGVNIRFHLVRSNENWLNEAELDKVDEAVLILSNK